MTAEAGTVSVNDIRAGRLPAAAAGVRWTDIDGYTECRAHLADPAWRPDALQDPDAKTGVVLTGYIGRCDPCAETGITEDQVRALRGEAAAAGDLDQVQACDRALGGSTTAWERCRQVIIDARARGRDINGGGGS